MLAEHNCLIFNIKRDHIYKLCLYMLAEHNCLIFNIKHDHIYKLCLYMLAEHKCLILTSELVRAISLYYNMFKFQVD